MSPGVTATGPAVQPTVRSPLGRFFFDHTIDEYPEGRRRLGYLSLAVLATIVLYYVYYTQTGVTPNILAGFHMSFAFYIGIIVVSNLLGAFASLPASKTDRLGRTNVVIYGLLIVGLLTAVGIPLCGGQWSYLVVTCLIGIVEGAILVATPALVRDFSPQLGRASAMGFWTIGPGGRQPHRLPGGAAHPRSLRPDPLEEPVRDLGCGRPGRLRRLAVRPQGPVRPASGTS